MLMCQWLFRINVVHTHPHILTHTHPHILTHTHPHILTSSNIHFIYIYWFARTFPPIVLNSARDCYISFICKCFSVIYFYWRMGSKFYIVAYEAILSRIFEWWKLLFNLYIMCVWVGVRACVRGGVGVRERGRERERERERCAFEHHTLVK